MLSTVHRTLEDPNPASARAKDPNLRNRPRSPRVTSLLIVPYVEIMTASLPGLYAMQYLDNVWVAVARADWMSAGVAYDRTIMSPSSALTRDPAPHLSAGNARCRRSLDPDNAGSSRRPMARV
jgi:hypothetical protein